MLIVLLRTVLIFIVLGVSMRLLGKRQLGELEVSELIVAVLVTNVAAQPLSDTGLPLLNALFPMAALFSCELLISGAALRIPRLRQLLYGLPSVLVKDGVIQQRAMRKNRVSIDELAEALRSGGVTDLSKVRYAILETDGEINPILFAEAQPLTRGGMNGAEPDGGLPHILINDGRVLADNLALLGLDRAWLEAELRRQGAKSSREVYYLSVDDARQVCCFKKEGL